jgi:hypothetical protein
MSSVLLSSISHSPDFVGDHMRRHLTATAFQFSYVLRRCSQESRALIPIHEASLRARGRLTTGADRRVPLRY